MTYEFRLRSALGSAWRLRSSWSLTLALLCLAVPLWAQPPVAPAQVQEQWRALQQQHEAQEVTQPRTAVQAYRAFLDADARTVPGVALDVVLRLGHLYARELQQGDVALQLYDQALAAYGRSNEGDVLLLLHRLRRERDLLQTRAEAREAEAREATPTAPKTGAFSAQTGGPLRLELAPPPLALLPAAPPPMTTVPAPGASLGATPLGATPLGAVPSMGRAPLPASPTASLSAPPDASGLLPSAPAPLGVRLPTATLLLRANSVALSLLLHELRAGTRTPQSAWQEGALGADDVFWLAEGGGGLNGWGDRVLRDELLLLVARHAPAALQARLQEKERLSDELRFALAEAFHSARDERAVGLYQGLIAELEQPGKKAWVQGEGWLAPVAGLARFYGVTGRWLLSAQTWEAGLLLSPHPHWQADARVAAARAYFAAGGAENEVKSLKLYAEVPRYGQGWLTGLAYYDQADHLIRQGKHEDARKLLKTPVEGEKSERIKIALLSQLAYSYFRTGEWEQAKSYIRQTIAQSEQALPKDDVGLIQAAAQVGEIQRLITHWEKQPIICEPATLKIAVQRQNRSHPVAIFFTARTFGEVPLVVTTEHPHLETQVAGKGVEEDAANYRYMGRAVLVQIAPEALNKSFETVLRVRSPRHPQFEATVTLSVEVE